MCLINAVIGQVDRPERHMSGNATYQELRRNGKLENLVKRIDCPPNFHPRLRKWLWKVVPNDFHFH